jgi:hypothetical protein
VVAREARGCRSGGGTEAAPTSGAAAAADGAPPAGGVGGARETGGGKGDKGGNGGTGRGGSGATAGGEADDRRSSQFVGVSWHSGRSKWVAQVTVDSKRVFVGDHATEEAAAQAIANYAEDGVDLVKRHGERTSQSKGVSWHKLSGKWTAAFKGRHLGLHATEEAAALAYTNYVKDGVDPVTRRDRTSQFKGVNWHKHRGKWWAKCKGKSLGYHATEEAAAQAYNIEAQRIGITVRNDIPPECTTGGARGSASTPATAATNGLSAKDAGGRATTLGGVIAAGRKRKTPQPQHEAGADLVTLFTNRQQMTQITRPHRDACHRREQ